ncbi:hypothetical protein [Methylobacterium platani]|uniref:Uncharacterized protein n=2 Tax=Methylobacterium platani TaxID=427683 RepID=A0A179SA60_9HYPH|nr:hypothetical protein [Methylobacterium platani]KMO18952.1 hypothetical protein SQ03_09230 [Methylobacterium platani JCM 14648]OAS23408.1 hypothetical protein A5481_17255 [Methylobacterium platani]
MAAGVDEKQPRYNPIFERFVPPDRADENVRGLIAYGLYKIAKREWAQGLQERLGRQPTPEEQDAYIATWTDSRLRGLEQQADATLAAFAETVVTEATPAIREDALRGTSGKSIGLSIAANAIYTLILIALALVLAWGGIDLIGLLQKARPSG